MPSIQLSSDCSGLHSRASRQDPAVQVSECPEYQYPENLPPMDWSVASHSSPLKSRRAIEPCRGKWTIPAGFMELNESTSEGAVRETWEEAKACVRVDAPYAYWDIPAIGQVRGATVPRPFFMHACSLRFHVLAFCQYADVHLVPCHSDAPLDPWRGCGIPRDTPV